MIYLICLNTEMTFVTYITKVLDFLVINLFQDNCFSLHNNISSKVHILYYSVNTLNDFNLFCEQNSNLDEESLVTYVTVCNVRYQAF